MHPVIVFLIVMGLVVLTAAVIAGLTWVFMNVVLVLGDSEMVYLHHGIRLQKKYGVIVPGLFPKGTRVVGTELADSTQEPPGAPIPPVEDKN